MNAEHARLIVELAEDQCQDDSDKMTFREEYSGRGMFGKSTAAITGNPIFIHRVVGNILSDITDSLEDGEPANKQEIFELRAVHSLLKAKEDGMGLGSVFY